MAADTRDRDSSSQQYSPAQASQDPNRKTYERFGNSPPSNCASNNSGTAVEVGPSQNANLLPGGTMNTAGGKVRESSILEAAKTIKLGDFRELHKKPCARESFLVGIGAGFGVGGLRAVMGAPILKACSWAVGTFAFGSFFMHEYCQRKRLLEIQGLKMAAELIDRKKTERRLEQMRAAKQKAREEAKGKS